MWWCIHGGGGVDDDNVDVLEIVGIVKMKEMVMAMCIDDGGDGGEHDDRNALAWWYMDEDDRGGIIGDNDVLKMIRIMIVWIWWCWWWWQGLKSGYDEGKV